MRFTVIIQRKAQRDVAESLRWWSRHGKAEAELWSNRLIAKVIAVLEAHPHQYPFAEEAAELGLDIRVMLYGKRRQVYRVLFTIEGDQVLVHRIRHSAQDRLTEGDL